MKELIYLSEKISEAIFQEVGNSLIEGNYVNPINKQGLIKNKTCFVPNREKVMIIIEKNKSRIFSGRRSLR